MLEFKKNDGGRNNYFKAEGVGDCVTRAIAIALNRDYKEVYSDIKHFLGYTPRNGVRHADVKRVMAHFNFSCMPLMKVGEGCKVHLRKDELPKKGRMVLNLSGHVSAYIDGVLNDTYDASRGGKRCVYGIWYVGDIGDYKITDKPTKPHTLGGAKKVASKLIKDLEKALPHTKGAWDINDTFAYTEEDGEDYRYAHLDIEIPTAWDWDTKTINEDKDGCLKEDDFCKANAILKEYGFESYNNSYGRFPKNNDTDPVETFVWECWYCNE